VKDIITPAHDESFAIDSPWDWNIYKRIKKKGGKPMKG